MPEYRILVPPPRRHRKGWTAAIAAAVVVAAAAGAFVVSKHGQDDRRRSQSRGGAKNETSAQAFAVVSTVPATGATDVPSDQVVTVRLSAPVVVTTGMPTFDPPVSGAWTRVGAKSLAFRATAPFLPTSTETLVIPDGSWGPRSTAGAMLVKPVTITFSVAQASTERLQQLLAQLDYLPLSFTPTGPLSSPAEATTAQAGSFAWRWPNPPSSLTSLWTEGYENVITKGAVMNFENQNGLAVDGLAGPRVWSTLLSDIAAAKVNADPYTYVVVSKQLPQSLTLFENGTPALVDIPVNTGAPGADTVDGTYPVFEHVLSSRMQGTNPDGTKYDDPNVPWASYFNGGDALHGFVRATYGSPQSNGCVEMRISDAAKVWPLSPIGTLVTVVGPAS
ncbi:MAG TPA: L,D-transpeptidase family protein [Acidimicrobiales bacterium]|nr:L,D-transpeptidase family protein [Acidimicrobiales bacterium]HLN41461.1 L,D-transpeptidase family protein [Acidimicrobiales bacterium]